jgi:hypothetical protein
MDSPPTLLRRIVARTSSEIPDDELADTKLLEEGVARRTAPPLTAPRLPARRDLTPGLVLLTAVALANVEQDVGRHRSGSAGGVGADALPREPHDVVDRVVVAPDSVGKVAQATEQLLEKGPGGEMVGGRHGSERPADLGTIVGVEAEDDHAVEVLLLT